MAGHGKAKGGLLSSVPMHTSTRGFRYHRAPRELHFPVEAEVPESKRHLDLRTALYTIIRSAFGESASIGSDQFVYWDASDPSKCLAPDLFVRRGEPDMSFGSWKTWERGAPELAVEIISDSDAPERVWEEKLERYHAAGIEEIVRFDPEEAEGERLRIWDRVDGDLVERVLEGDLSPCWTLGGAFLVQEDEKLGPMLRLSRDARGEQLWPTPEESHRAEARAREAEARAREAETRAREAAEARVRELEEELRRRGG